MCYRIKYITSKKQEERECHPKEKGHGKSKKSIESKPVRKEIFLEPVTFIGCPLLEQQRRSYAHVLLVRGEIAGTVIVVMRRSVLKGRFLTSRLLVSKEHV